MQTKRCCWWKQLCAFEVRSFLISIYFPPAVCLPALNPPKSKLQLQKWTGPWYLFRFVRHVGCSWQLAKKKGCTKHKKRLYAGWGDEPFWQILATRQMHKSEVWEDVFLCACVCVYACGPACIIQRTVVLPHRAHSGDDCLWPPASTDIPSELLLNCHHLSFPKEWPRLPRCLPVANFISYFSDEILNPPLTHTHTRRLIHAHMNIQRPIRCSQRRWEARVTKHA